VSVGCGNALVWINVVTRATPGPVGAWTPGDVLGRVNHLGAGLGTQFYSVLSLSHISVGRRNEYPAKAGEVNRHIA